MRETVQRKMGRDCRGTKSERIKILLPNRTTANHHDDAIRHAPCASRRGRPNTEEQELRKGTAALQEGTSTANM